MSKPFLKWIGGKNRIADFIGKKILSCQKNMIEKNKRYHKSQQTRFVEPFVGSAAISIQVCKHFDSILLADYNEDLINLYSILNTSNSASINNFIYQVTQNFREETHTKEKYYELRTLFNNTNISINPELRAALFVYLNRHGFNGMCRYNSTGGFNIPVGHYVNPPTPSIKEMVEFSNMLVEKNAELIFCSFEDVLKSSKHGDVVYCDPPYIPLSITSSFTAYTSDGFSNTQHQQLADLALSAKKRGACVLISNHHVKGVTDVLYKHATRPIVPFNVQRTVSAKVSSRKPVEEILAIYEP